MIFEVHESPRSSSEGRGVPTLRIMTGGRLVLNAAAQRMLKGVSHVQLLWEADSKRIGIRSTDASDRAGVLISRAPSQATITSMSFVTAHALPLHTRMPLEPVDGMWVASTTAAAIETSGQ